LAEKNALTASIEASFHHFQTLKKQHMLMHNVGAWVKRPSLSFGFSIIELLSSTNNNKNN
jgi:hypothetical protein